MNTSETSKQGKDKSLPAEIIPPTGTLSLLTILAEYVDDTEETAISEKGEAPDSEIEETAVAETGAKEQQEEPMTEEDDTLDE